MSEKTNEEMSFPIEVPNNTFGIFVSCEPGSQNIVLHLHEFVDGSARGRQKNTMLWLFCPPRSVEAIGQIIDSFVEEVDEDFTQSEFTDGDQYGLPFPKINPVN
jgi:hypothetical protein